MRTIEVTTDVFAAIWAARQPGEDTECEILERLLGIRALQGEQEGRRSSTQSRGKQRWVDDIVLALRNLGGGAFYAEIYQEVRAIRIANTRSVPRSFEEVIRKEIETHSSDSDAFMGREDYFCAPQGKGAGYWQLREAQTTQNTPAAA